MRRKLVIDRSIWLRGEGNEDSYLLRNTDNKMCCLGIYLEACGVSRERLGGIPTPSELANLDVEVPKEAEWLVNKKPNPTPSQRWEGTPWAHRLMEENDDVLPRNAPKDIKKQNEHRREANIAQLFRANGVEVEFIN